MKTTWTCKCCGEINTTDVLDPHDTLKSVCWECGMPRDPATIEKPVDRRTEEEKIDAAMAEMQKKAEQIFPVLAAKLQSESKMRLVEIVIATCKQHGIVFAKRFMSLLAADDRFAAVVSVMSPAQREGRF